MQSISTGTLEGLECCIYSPQYLHRVKHVGTNCARCRALPVHYGCSFASRRCGQGSFVFVPERPRQILLKTPDGSRSEDDASGAVAGASSVSVDSGSL